ncbi:hypothetical protein [Dysgonomonas macrotermitis]|uniref:Uncharacterized protein n=1 Tax=Dysgonomonas macrotermitis TaxID=1346286 RepID=A0A1M4X7S7_9BACT|nr:hypothetical protein [Dysgonomonas macrotermitis]SHE89182.1 hypothetical protein SAMN05444362_102420 [Dysgonomonas macrotermitis]
MKKYIILLFVLCISPVGNLLAKNIIADSLVFVYSLHGQTRRYETTFEEKGDTLYMNWGIERNLKWQSGSYGMGKKSVAEAIRLSFLQPEDGKHVQLPSEETVAILSQAAYKQLKEHNSFVYNQTKYSVLDTNEKTMGHNLIHVIDNVEGCEIWILDNPRIPIVWRMRNNPLGINWEVQQISSHK